MSVRSAPTEVWGYGVSVDLVSGKRRVWTCRRSRDPTTDVPTPFTPPASLRTPNVQVFSKTSTDPLNLFSLRVFLHPFV